MKPLIPGQAALTRLDGKVTLVACDFSGVLPLGKAAFEIRGGMHPLNIGNVLVPAVSVVLRLTVGDATRFYWAWVNELEEGVIESLATQPDLPIVLADPLGASFGRATVPNGIKELAQKHLGVISRHASEAPWTPAHFAACKTFVECHYPTAEKEWAALDKSAKHF